MVCVEEYNLLSSSLRSFLHPRRVCTLAWLDTNLSWETKQRFKYFGWTPDQFLLLPHGTTHQSEHWVSRSVPLTTTRNNTSVGALGLDAHRVLNKWPFGLYHSALDRLCGLVVRVLDYRCRGPGFDSRALRKEKKSSGSGTGCTQPREYNWGVTWQKSSGSCLENREYGLGIRHADHVAPSIRKS
jgi:hypothetical protein